MTSKPFLTALSLMLLLTGNVYAQQSDDATAQHPNLERGHSPKSGHHKKMQKHRMQQHVRRTMEKIDANEDGKVDLSEYLAHTEQRFKRVDTDNDGFVTSEEMRTALKEMRKEHRKAMKEAHKSNREANQDQE